MNIFTLRAKYLYDRSKHRADQDIQHWRNPKYTRTIEFLLFHSASSLENYRDMKTFTSRIQRAELALERRGASKQNELNKDKDHSDER